MTLHFDCFAGISGDMTLGALVDLGVPEDALRAELRKLDLPGWELEFVREQRCGITGMRASVTEHGAGEGRHEHDHRHWSDIREMITRAPLSPGAKERAVAIFEKLARAEAEVHGSSPDNVAFHEVGAVDSIIDIVGAAVCLDILKPARVTAGAVELGGGTVKCAHGILPVPAPAVRKLLKDVPVRSGLTDKEMTTPTGAAILAACADEFLPSGCRKVVKTGAGLGSREFDSVPNVLFAELREEDPAGGGGETLLLLEANIDDMTGEELGFLSEELLSGGALDVTLAPCVMKKSRPGTIVSALCRPASSAALRKIFWTKSSTIGLRETSVIRYALARSEKILPGGARVKEVVFEGGVRGKVEYEDRAALAREKNVSLAEAGLMLMS